MEISEALIQQLIQGNCSAAEARAVIESLEKDPALVDRYFSEEEWQAFRYTDTLSSAAMEEALHHIQAATYKKPTAIKRSMVISIAASAAAAVIIVAMAGYWWQQNKTNNETAVAANTSNTVTTITDSNTTAMMKSIALEDGSVIELEPGSVVNYARSFPVNRRVIGLQGIAFFKVAKDKTRPFEVQANGFSTIALGTSFRVTALPTSSQVNVQLYTGKVVIKQTNIPATATDTFTNVILVPGQELTINTSSLQSRLETMKDMAVNTPAATTNKPMANWNKYVTADSILFNNTPVTDIFAALEQHFSITIKYNQKEVAGISFTGSFTVTEQPKEILSTITSVNHLVLRTDGHTSFTVHSR